MRCLRNFRLLSLTGAVLLAAGGFVPVHAQDEPGDLQRAVARISLINGDVSVRRGDSGDWVAGIINAPLLAEDQIATGPNSRAEIQFDAANVLRLGGNAEIRLTQLEYGRYQMEIAHGTVTYDIVRPSSVNVEVDTPNVAVKPSKQGIYRISVNDAGVTEVTVRAGDVEVFTPSGSQVVQTGQSLMARGSASDAEFQVVAAIPYDDWDRWNAQRDAALSQVASNQYVPQGVYGTEDLDAYGSWGYVEPYGYCWHPTVMNAGWAPYQSGSWVWEDWYGWTWVSYDPWGWAPYHYGRWFSHAGGWWWYPGVIGRRHYWSPALVAFFGFGNGVGVGFGFANVGWVPLAPYETFHPWWGRGYYGSRTYIDRSINITNVNVTNIYRNARVAHGVSGISAGDFAGGRFHNVRSFSGSQIREAGLIRGQMPIGPTSHNLRFSDRTVANVPASRGSERFFTHQQPGAVQRVPFAQQQRTFDPMARSAAREPAPQAAQGALRSQAPAANTAPRQAQNPGAGGWRRFGGSTAPSGSANSPQQRTPANNADPAGRGGWQRFGEPSRGPNQQFAPSPQSSAPGNSGFGRFGGSPNSAARDGQQSLRVSPPVVRQRENYNRPAQSAPRYQAPRQLSAPRSYSPPAHSAPRSSPQRSSAPRSNSGGSRGGRRH
jgi:Family of unknown function (DUF6600)/FecR protein